MFMNISYSNTLYTCKHSHVYIAIIVLLEWCSYEVVGQMCDRISQYSVFKTGNS